MRSTRPLRIFVVAVLALVARPVWAQEEAVPPARFIRENYVRKDYQIPMRDGTKLYTIVYAPKEQTEKYPILLTRTPYGIGPYDPEKFRDNLGPNKHFIYEKYIFAYQDVRGRYMSEGEFENMRPQLAAKDGIDESTDTYDTIEFLLKNVPNNNERVGQWGISYPGFYTSAGMINSHPALKASSPQAPIANWFYDDWNHHGAFFLTHAFTFFATFGQARPEPSPERPTPVNFGTPDGYQFFLDLGALRNANPKYFKDRIAYWNTLAKHPNYDDYWKKRNLLPHLKGIKSNVLTVGGWYDAEDLYGTFNTYRAVEKQNPGIFNALVIGPWAHGGWSGAGDVRLGDALFGENTAEFYQEKIELPFFNHFLKDKGKNQLPEAYVFETGRNAWRQFETWPPPGVSKQAYYFAAGEKLSAEPARESPERSRQRGDRVLDFDEFTSDPNRPVPYTEAISFGMLREYMTGDQRYAARRPDVLVYQTEPLEDDVTIAGPLEAELQVSTSAGDADWVVKLIDVFPPTSGKNPITHHPMGGYQMLVRSEVVRGRFRDNPSKPVPFKANEPSLVKVPLQDVLHTFRPGHRIMVQVCSSWFPLVDRNPQKWVPNIFEANDADFIKARHRVYRSGDRASVLRFSVLAADPRPQR